MGKNHTTQQLNDSANKYFAKEKVYDAIEAQNKLSINSYTAYVEADAFIGNPYSLLGRVLMIRKNGGKCPESINDKEFTTQLAPLPIKGVEVDEKSKIEQPIRRGSIVVTKDLSVKVGLLNYLSAELSANSTFSIMVFDQITGLINVQAPSWENGLNQWIMNPLNASLLQDSDVCYLYAIVGIVQKNVIRKKYTKLDSNAGGGAYGININGEIHTSNEEYFLDIRFGITPVILKSPTYTIQLPKIETVEKMSLMNELSKSTKFLVDFSMKNKKNIKYSLPNESELNVFSGIQKIV
jgi:hypothetical protein